MASRIYWVIRDSNLRANSGPYSLEHKLFQHKLNMRCEHSVQSDLNEPKRDRGLAGLHWSRLYFECLFNMKIFGRAMHLYKYYLPRTTDAQRGNSLHCTAENLLPHQIFRYGWSTSAQFLWFMPSLSVRTPWF